MTDEEQQAWKAEFSMREHDNADPEDPGFVHPDEGTVEVGEYPLEKLEPLMDGGRAGWSDWFAEEIGWMRSEGMASRADFLETFMDGNNADPILVSENNEVACLWDGFHRTGAAFAGNRTTVKAAILRKR